MRMNLRMKKCWMKRDGPGSNWRYVHLLCVCDCVVVCIGWNRNELKASSVSKKKSLACQHIQRWVWLTGEWPEFVILSTQVENTIRWRAKRDEEGNETRESNARIVKWSDGRCVLCEAGCRGYYTVNRTCSVPSVVLNVCSFLAAACPSTWGTKCLMFTKRLSRETTTTCSYDKAPDCRDRLCSKPNSHSGNTVN